MPDRKQWARFIRQNSANRLGRINRSLFNDIPQTLVYLQGIYEVLGMAPQLPIEDLIATVRTAFLQLSEERFEEAVRAINAAENNEGLFVIVLGSRRGDDESARLAMTRLAELATRQLRVLKKGMTLSGAMTAIITLIAASRNGATHTWTNLLHDMRRRGDATVLRRILTCAFLGMVECSVIPLSEWPDGAPVFTYDHIRGTLIAKFPAPDQLAHWLSREITLFIQAAKKSNEGIHLLSSRLREQIATYASMYESMWLDMMVEPQWGLRDGGIDRVSISVQEFREYGYQYVQLFPRDPFPNFRARLYNKKQSNCVEFDLEPTDLVLVRQADLPEDSPLLWADRLLAFVVVRAVWHIVMGHLSHDSPGTGTRTGGATSAIVRPRFRRLPEGHKSSPEARARALETFRTEPLPGFTFVRQYERGLDPQSGAPLFDITDADL